MADCGNSKQVHGQIIKEIRCTISAWPEVVLRFCTRLQNWTGGSDPSSSLCPHYVYIISGDCHWMKDLSSGQKHIPFYIAILHRGEWDCIEEGDLWACSLIREDGILRVKTTENKIHLPRWVSWSNCIWGQSAAHCKKSLVTSRLGSDKSLTYFYSDPPFLPLPTVPPFSKVFRL